MADFWHISADDHPALLLPDGGRITYRDLVERAENWQQRLQTACPSARRPLVALEFATHVECIAAYLACLRCGLPLLVVAPGQLSTPGALVRIWQPELQLICADDGLTLTTQPHSAAADTADPHADLALLLSTSGSTGDPKLVRLSATNIASNAAAIAQYLEIPSEGCAATTLPFYYSYGLSVLNSYLAAHATVALISHSMNSPAFWDQARSARVTSLALVPSQFDFLRSHMETGTALPSLRTVTQAGGTLSARQQRQFHQMGQAQGWDLVVMYGQTEAAPRIAYVPPDRLPEAFGTIGRAIPGGRLWLADTEGQPITTPGREGELVYEGPNVMMGYGETRADLARGADQTCLHTGDLAEQNPEGYFQITGRLKRFVKLYGLRLNLDRIEADLERAGFATHAVAVEDQLVVFHKTPDPRNSQPIVETLAAAYDLPATAICVTPLQEPPLLASGKVDSQALAQLARRALEQRPPSHAEPPSTLIRRLTRQPDADPALSFLDLGGNSLMALEVQLVLEQRLGQAPRQWETRPLAELDRILPTRAASTELSLSWRQLDVEVVLRVLALALVITQHASSYPAFGGPWMLLALMGASTARFQCRRIARGQVFALARAMLWPILPLYFLILVTYGLLRDPVPLSFVLLLGNYHQFSESSLLMVYWFISLYAQITLLLMVITAVPALRQQVVTKPWSCAAGGAAALLLVQGLGLWLGLGGPITEGILPFPIPHPVGHGMMEALPVFCLGWALWTMRTPLQQGITAVLAAVLLGQAALLPLPATAVALLGLTLALMVWKPPLFLPRPLVRLLQELATATLFTYLLHQIAVTLCRYWLDLPDPLAVLGSLILSFALAVAVKRLLDRLGHWGSLAGLHVRHRVGSWIRA